MSFTENKRKEGVIVLKQYQGMPAYSQWSRLSQNFFKKVVNLFSPLKDFIHRLKSSNHFVQRNNQYHRNTLLISFYFKGHTLGFHSQYEKLEPPCTA